MTRAGVALAVWLLALSVHALAIVADPSTDGVLRGIETVHASVERLEWTGPYGRSASLDGPGPFEVWRHPLWPAVEGSFETSVSHPLSPAEGVYVALTMPGHRLAFVLVVFGLLRHGRRREAAALALFLGVVRALQPAWFFDSDPARYQASAQAILAGEWPDLLWPPAWPAAWALVGGGMPAGRLLGAALVAACARFAPSQGAAVLVAVSAELIGFGPALYSEPLFVLAGLLALRGSAWGGALAALTRAHALAVVPLVARPAWVIPVAMWAVLASLHAGHPVLVSEGLGMNLWIGHGPGATGDWRDPGIEPAGGWLAAAGQAIAADPAAALARTGRTAARLWSFSTSDRTLASRPLPLPMLPFGGLVVLAAIGAWRRPDRSALAWLAATTVVTACFFAPVRYKLGLYPGLLVLAGSWIGGREVGRGT